MSVKKWGSGGGTVSDIVLKDIFLTGGPDAPSIIQGLPSSKLRPIRIENLNYKGERMCIAMRMISRTRLPRFMLPDFSLP